MKSTVILFVALLMLVKPLWPIGEYIMNYDYIVKNLCINKERPRLKCNGKCYLVKQLAKESEETNNNPFKREHSKNKTQEIVFFQMLFRFDFKNEAENTVKNNYKTTQEVRSKLLITDISPPPKFG
ncbi:hypothetical protein ATO12_04770 [Aquimarina atlantica]|uniref:Uncharacterized protein n=1 Tax=Aquimarina atlantica TaxID=1317122 RepID=A0A023BPC3_9FLAO|nr:hypothetical protein [Aquimarina atlantica]EZH71935.1 hypothetical protein ATO12_04770 [Aquimarina atlantica]